MSLIIANGRLSAGGNRIINPQFKSQIKQDEIDFEIIIAAFHFYTLLKKLILYIALAFTEKKKSISDRRQTIAIPSNNAPQSRLHLTYPRSCYRAPSE